MVKSTLVTLSVKGMSCGGCVSSVEKALLSVSGVEEVTVNLAEHTARIKGEASVSTLIKSVVDAGYDATDETANT